MNRRKLRERYTFVHDKNNEHTLKLPDESGYYTVIVQPSDPNKPLKELRAYFYGNPSMSWSFGDGTSKDIIAWK